MKETLNSRRGSVLLFCLGVLALLSMLGTMLVFLSSQQESEAKGFLLNTRAQFTAESGVDAAIAKLSSYSGSLLELPKVLLPEGLDLSKPLEHATLSSFGNLDTNNDGTLDAAGYVSETFHKEGEFYRLAVSALDGRLNLNDVNSPPNWDSDAYEDQTHPDRIFTSIPDHLRPPVDTLDFDKPGTSRLAKDPDWLYSDDAEFDRRYSPSLKPYPRDVFCMVIPESGGSPILKPFLENGDSLVGVKPMRRLSRILAELVDALFPASDYSPAKPEDPCTLGDAVAFAVFDSRIDIQGDRFNSLDEVERALVPGILNAGEWKVLSLHLTLQAWKDETVLKPTFQWRISRPDTVPNYVNYGLNESPYVGGDLKTTFIYEFVSNCKPPIRRPLFGSPHNIKMMDDEDSPWETILGIRHPGSTYLDNRSDIYLFSDMQTKFFELEARCPINVNAAGLPLIQALIRPLNCWMLKEEAGPEELLYKNKLPPVGPYPPAVDKAIPVLDPVTGEALWHPMAEDWSMPLKVDTNGYGFGSHPWFYGWGKVVLRLAVDQSPGGNYDGFLSGIDCYGGSDEMSYNYYDETSRSWVYKTPPNGMPVYPQKNCRFGGLLKVSMTPSVADQVAQAIYLKIHPDTNTFHPFGTWEEFQLFLRDLAEDDKPITGDDPVGYIPGFTPAMADMLVANFNPNSRINDFNPDKNHYLRTDKSKLLVNTTEFSFTTMGQFEIRSLGEVRGPKGETVASSQIRANIDGPFKILRLTSQSQFMEGYDPLNGKQAEEFLGVNDGWAETAGLRFSSGGSVVAAYPGHQVQSYPEPELATGANLISASKYDGFLKPAVIRPGKSEMYNGAGNTVFHVDFQGKLNADYAVDDLLCYGDQGTQHWVWDNYAMHRYLWRRNSVTSGGTQDHAYWSPDYNAKVPANLPGERALTRPLSASFSTVLPGNLYPDGAFSDAGRSLKYSAKNIGASPGRTGALQFWLKPGFNVAFSNRVRQFFTMAPKDIKPNYVAEVVNLPAGANPATFPAGSNLITTEPPGGSIPPALSSVWYSVLANYETWVHGYDFSMNYFAHGGSNIPAADILEEIPYHGYTPEQAGRWIPTRSIYLFTNGWIKQLGTSVMGAKFMPSIGTDCVNQSWHSAADMNSSPLTNKYHMETRQWNHVSFAWKMDVAQNPVALKPFYRMYVNGLPVEDLNGQDYATDSGAYPKTPPTLHTLWDGSKNYVRFGEASSAPFRNVSADSTYDIIASNSLDMRNQQEAISIEYSFGRYYGESKTAYISPQIDLPAKLGLSGDVTLQLGGIAWTCYWPQRDHSQYVPANGRFNDMRSTYANAYINVPPALARDSSGPYGADPVWGDLQPLSLNIMNPQNSKWYYADSSGATSEMPNCAGISTDPNWAQSGMYWNKGFKFQFKAYFNLDDNQSYYSAPVLDDVTFYFICRRVNITHWDVVD